MSELQSEFDLKPVERASMGGASDATGSRAWRRRLNAIRTNEFVNDFVRTCLLSLVAIGPVPSMRLRERRNH